MTKAFDFSMMRKEGNYNLVTERQAILTQKDKLLGRLFQNPYPRDFTYGELLTLMKQCGYQVRQGNGSRISFGPNAVGNRLFLHAPHGATENALKKYQIEQIKAFLEKEGLLK